jgi:antitoxin ParD1/3/4
MGFMGDRQEKLTTMNVSLPESLRTFAEQRARSRYSSASEYIRELIRRDQREAAKEKLEELLIEGLESGKPIVVTEDYWEKKRQDLAGRHGKNTRK